jgi:integrase
MAHIHKTATGWRVQIERKGVRKSATLPTKSAAIQWAAQEEAAILSGAAARWPSKTVADAIDKYVAEVSVTKRGARAEELRLAAFARDHPGLAGKVISEVTTADLAVWRDARLKRVSPGSVQREIGTLRNMWIIAAREWQWTQEPSPWRALRMPGDNPPRDRLYGWREIRRIMRRCGFVSGQPPRTGLQSVAWAFLASLRTAMRAGEILSLTRDTVDLPRRVVTLHKHKTVEAVGKRQVPLTPAGVRVLAVLVAATDDKLISLSSASLDVLFRKMAQQSLVVDAHFHDARATALTSMSRRMDVLTLARISGHKDLSLIMSTYYRESAADVSARLAKPKPSPR